MTIRSVDISGHKIDIPRWSDSGEPVWVDVRPNLRRFHVLAGDVLAALGKRRDVGGKGRNESEDVRLAAAWLAAHDVPHLAVVDAQRLDPRILHSLTKLAAAAETDLWLLHRPPVSDVVHRAITRHSAEAADLSRLPAARVTPLGAVPRHTDEPAVPSHDVHAFISAVRATLPPEEAANVLADFSAAATATLRRIGASDDAAGAVIAELVVILRRAPSDSLLVTQIRGVQNAAWNHNLHVSVDLPQLLNSEERPRVSTDKAGPFLLAYRQPYRAITWYLAAHNIGLDEAATITIDAVAGDGSSIQTSSGALEVSSALRPAVRAQRALRIAGGAHAEARLLSYTTKTLSYALTDAAHDLGLPAHGRLAERQNTRPHAWLKKLGVTIRTLP